MHARRIVNTRTDNLKKVTFGVMAILFFVNLSLMEKANRTQTTEVSFHGAGIDRSRQSVTKPPAGATEAEFLRVTANRLQAAREELVAEIGRIESRIRALELQNRQSE